MISIPRRPALTLATGAALVLLAAAPAVAQGRISMRMNSDTTAHVVSRLPLSYADASLRTRDRAVALLLTGDDVILQLTDHGLGQVGSQIRHDGDDKGFGSRIVAMVLGAGVNELLDHGLAVPLRMVRRARMDGTRLVLEDRDGHDLFGETEVNGTQVMEEFAPAEARRFADAVNRALRERRVLVSAPRR